MSTAADRAARVDATTHRPALPLVSPVPHDEISDPAITARLDRWFAKAREFVAAFTPIDDRALEDPDTALSRTQLLSLAIGFVGCHTLESRSSRTYTLVYTDSDHGKSNYQTVCVPYYAPSSPITLVRTPESNRARLLLRASGDVLAETSVHASIHGASSHYYSRVSPAFQEMPTAAIVSPYSTCAGGCLGCSRGAVRSFTAPPSDYIERHVGQLAADYDSRGWDRAELVSVNITTGCQPDEDRELDMMLRLIAAYRRQGFSAAQFFPFTYAIDSDRAMGTLLDAGCLGFIGTVECVNDVERIRQWGRKKGSITFAQHLDKYRRARRVGFPIVETDYVLGADSYHEMLAGIAALDSNQVAVVPNVKRNYSVEQLNSNHPDIWRRGLEYISAGFNACLASYNNGTIKRRAARATVAYLRRNGQPNVTLRDLPIRHT